MLPALSKCRSSLTRWNGIWLVALAAAAVALPTVRSIALGQTNPQEKDKPAASDKPSAEPVEYLPRPSAAEQQILAALEKPITLKFTDEPLANVVQSLREQTGLNIVLDRPALEEEGITSDTPVSLHVRDLPLRDGLELLLEQLNLTFTVTKHVLKITSLLQAGNHLITRTYPVRDLCPEPDGFKELKDAIETTISPNSWTNVGGQGTAVIVKASGSVVISQTQHVQDQILQLIRDLREARRKQAKEESQ